MIPTPLTYQCVTCGTIFENPVFEIVRDWERVDYSDSLPCVDIESSEVLECYCSPACMDARTLEVMKRENTPIRRPGIGPIERCARCQGVVDMSYFHLTYLQSKGVWKDGGFETPEIDYLAVLCRQCAPEPLKVGETMDIDIEQEQTHLARELERLDQLEAQGLDVSEERGRCIEERETLGWLAEIDQLTKRHEERVAGASDPRDIGA